MTYYNDFNTLRTELDNGLFEQNIPSIDTYKVVDSLKFLVEKVAELETEIKVTEANLSFAENISYKLQKEVLDFKELFRMIAKDYPEIVLSKPHLFKEKIKQSE